MNANHVVPDPSAPEPAPADQGRTARHRGQARRAAAMVLAVASLGAPASVTAAVVGHGGGSSAATVISRVVQPVTGTVQPALRGSSWALPASKTTRVGVTSLARGSSWS